MNEIQEQVIRNKVKRLMKAMGVSKKKLGEVLGSKGDHVNVRINRANRFVSGAKKKLTIQEVNKISEFFGKPTTWFFQEEALNGRDTFGNRADMDKERTMRRIEEYLKKLNLGETYVSIQLAQIRAMVVSQNQK